jgi:plasmid stability protein
MPAIHIRDVPEATISALRERAKRHGHSMQQELREILASAAAQPSLGEAREPIQLVTVNNPATTTWTREEIYGDEGR